MSFDKPLGGKHLKSNEYKTGLSMKANRVNKGITLEEMSIHTGISEDDILKIEFGLYHEKEFQMKSMLAFLDSKKDL